MRLAAFALCVLAAAACAKAPDVGAGGGMATSAAGPDAILLRFPRLGGTARAYRWWRDSSIWNSTQRAPAIADAVAYDDALLMAAKAEYRLSMKEYIFSSRLASVVEARCRGVRAPVEEESHGDKSTEMRLPQGALEELRFFSRGSLAR